MKSSPETPRLLLASNNAHKREELARILAKHEIVLPREAGIDFDFEEEEDTYRENALGKALALFRLARDRVPLRGVIADDSGLSVHALGGRPGVHSNRYGARGGRLLRPEEKNRLLLEELASAGDRSAAFVCALVLAVDHERFYVLQETLQGEIARAPRGVGGFGYDPVFLVPGLGRTVAELSPAEKDAVSHRGRAARRLAAILESLDRDREIVP